MPPHLINFSKIFLGDRLQFTQCDDGNQNENVDYFGVLHEILELEYSGWPIKRIVLF
ncbi:hypothetical protein RDI58_008366 [Solanum bulbocastanum]|uniref:Uncharacterized protein n=1 Tax=Solanum bulbocastanum TaxID=147425 RepID=A0AAN8TUT0_SOLBU